MPELPEVETVRRGLEPVLVGNRLVSVEVRRPDLRWPFPDRLAERLTGRVPLAVRRRSKYVLVDLDGDETLILHLGMSGRILISDLPAQSTYHVPARHDRHDHVEMLTEAGQRIVFNDPRRFGAIDLTPTPELDTHRLLSGLGPEPFSNAFSPAYLAGALKGRRAPIKSALLDQRLVAGLGNIYVCEALFRAGIDPRRAAGRISGQRLENLAGHIRDVLIEAIRSGGSSLRDHRQTNGELGYFQHNFAVYDREGEPCVREGCKGTVRRIVQSGRSTFHCPKCQR